MRTSPLSFFLSNPKLKVCPRLVFLAVPFFVPVRSVLLEGNQEYESSRRDLRSRAWIAIEHRCVRMLVQVNQLPVCTLKSLRLATFCSLIRVQQIHFKQRNRHLHQKIATLRTCKFQPYCTSGSFHLQERCYPTIPSLRLPSCWNRERNLSNMGG